MNNNDGRLRLSDVQLTVAFYNSDYYGYLETEEDREEYRDMTRMLAGHNKDALQLLSQLSIQTAFLPHPLQPAKRTQPRLPEEAEPGYPLQPGDDYSQPAFWEAIEQLRMTAPGQRRASFQSGADMVRLLRALPFNDADFRLSRGAEAFEQQLIQDAVDEMRADEGLAARVILHAGGVDEGALGEEGRAVGDRLVQRACGVLSEERVRAATAAVLEALEGYVRDELLPALRAQQRQRCEQVASMLICMFQEVYLRPVLAYRQAWHQPLQQVFQPAVQSVVALYRQLATGDDALTVYRESLRAPLRTELRRAFEIASGRRGWEAAAAEFNESYWNNELRM